MAYSVNLIEAARRHLAAALKLQSSNQREIAGYLYGLAAECAVKELARTQPAGRRDDILYSHFPELRTLLLEVLQGRRAQSLLRLIESASFLNEWHVKMRYAPTDEIRGKPIDAWASQASRAVTTMEAEGGA